MLVTGCATVPSTKFSIDPNTGVVTLDSPKNVSFNNLDATLAGGNHIVIQGYSSTNAPDVIAAVAAANAAMADRMIEAMKILEAMATKSAVGVNQNQPAFYMQVAPVDPGLRSSVPPGPFRP